jgi:hypothetical protein
MRVIILILASLPAMAVAEPAVFIQVLGVAQDAGYPQTNCYQPHCMRAWENKALRRMASTSGIPVYVMPRMHDYLSSNGPWDQLVRLQNIELRQLTDSRKVELNARLSVTPLEGARHECDKTSARCGKHAVI